MRELLSFWKYAKPSRRQPKSGGLGANLENCEERTLLSGVAIYPAQAAEVDSVEKNAKEPKKVKFRIGVSNSSNSTMFISLTTTSLIYWDSAQYSVKPMSSKSFNFKLDVDSENYPGTGVIVSVDVGSLTRMNAINFLHRSGQEAVDQHQTNFDFRLSQLDVAEWADGFVWSSNPRHK